MTHDITAPGHVVKAIESFAATIAHYLLPVIRFVGHRDERFAALAKLYPALTHEKRHSGDEADLVIFDHFPNELLEDPSALDADAAYLFCLESADELPRHPPGSLNRLNALSLVAPTIDELLRHVTAQLMVKDLSYGNGQSTFPELLSVDRDRRRALSGIVSDVLALRPSLITVPSQRSHDALIGFLFDAMDDAIAPVRIDGRAMEPALLASDRYNLVDGSALADDELAALFHAGIDGERPPLMVVRVADACPAIALPEDVAIRSLGTAEPGELDLQLQAYVVAARHSHRSGTVERYPTATVRDLLTRSGGDPFDARHPIDSPPSDESGPREGFDALLERYKRLSLDSILEEAERSIMRRLRERSPTVGAASHASGIPTVTWHKRTARLANKSSLIELLASARTG